MEAEPIGFIFFLIILNWVTIKIRSLHLKFISLVKRSSFTPVEAKDSVIQNNKSGLKLSKEEVEIVMERIGMLYNNEESERVEEEMSSDYITAMFAEEEPSLGEVMEAFDAFDENCDGFIDALELQRVLLKLGFGDLGLEECEGMIRIYDENGDGLIDCSEFVKFMDRSFC